MVLQLQWSGIQGSEGTLPHQTWQAKFVMHWQYILFTLPMARESFVQCWPFDSSCSSFNTAKLMEEITHFRHYLLNIAKHTFYLVLCSLPREGRTTNTMRRVVKILSHHKSTSKAMTTDSRSNIKLQQPESGDQRRGDQQLYLHVGLRS